MSTYYVDSNQIKVFPTSKDRTAHEDFANRLYEYNLANMIRQLTDNDSFIISGSININGTDVKSSDTLKLNVHGYYFEIEANSTLLTSVSTGVNVYACISVDKDSNQLLGQDDNDNKYHGLEFRTDADKSTDEGTNANIYYLKLWDGNKVPDESYIKFTSKSLNLEINGIDGKREFV